MTAFQQVLIGVDFSRASELLIEGANQLRVLGTARITLRDKIVAPMQIRNGPACPRPTAATCLEAFSIAGRRRPAGHP